jgi:hypothetical protein
MRERVFLWCCDGTQDLLMLISIHSTTDHHPQLNRHYYKEAAHMMIEPENSPGLLSSVWRPRRADCVRIPSEAFRLKTQEDLTFQVHRQENNNVSAHIVKEC